MNINFFVILIFGLFVCASCTPKAGQGNSKDKTEVGQKTKVDMPSKSHNEVDVLQRKYGWKWSNRPALEEGGKDYILVFKKDGNFALSLDINNCFGTYETGGVKMQFGQGIGCTEACCDKKAAHELTMKIAKVNKWKIEGKKLSLMGDGVELIFSSVPYKK